MLDTPDEHTQIISDPAPEPSSGIEQGEITNVDLWTEVTDSLFVAASLIWYLQKFFSTFPPAKENYPYSSDAMERNRITIELAYTTPANELPQLPAIIVYPPNRRHLLVGAGDFGWQYEKEGEDGYYERNYSGRFEYTIVIEARSDTQSSLSDIMSLLSTAFGFKYWKMTLTHYTGLWVDPSVSIDHIPLQAIGFVDGAMAGRKIFSSQITFGLISYGGLTNRQTIREIQDIIVHMQRTNVQT